jgi:hypothetical protein
MRPGLPHWHCNNVPPRCLNHKLDAIEQSIVTDPNGNYSFTNLPADPEILRVILPNGDQQTFPTHTYVGGFLFNDLAMACKTPMSHHWLAGKSLSI